MFLVKKPLDENKPDFLEAKGGPVGKFSDHLTKQQDELTCTFFGRHRDATIELGRLLALKFRDSEKDVIVTNIGIGGRTEMEKIDGTKIILSQAPVEPFELLNQLWRVIREPKKVTLNVADISREVLKELESVKAKGVLKISAGEGGREYQRRFFTDFQGAEEDGFILVKIPEKWMKRIVCLKPFDIRKEPAPVKADITFAFTLPSTLATLENLVKSTKQGGYLITDVCHKMPPNMIDTVELEKEYNADKADIHYRVYKVNA
jgi:hypothetical protein